MMDFFRKHMRTIFLITILGFLAGMFLGFGGYLLGKGPQGDAVAEVNGKKISGRAFRTLYNQAMQNVKKGEENLSEEAVKAKKQEVLRDLIQEEVFYQESKKYGITVPNGELAASIQSYPAFQKDGNFSQQAYFEILYRVLRTTPEEFEESRRRQIAIYKLRQIVADSVRISEPELRLEYARANKGDMSKFNDKKEEFLQQVRQEKVMMAFQEWYKVINQTFKVKLLMKEIFDGQAG